MSAPRFFCDIPLMADSAIVLPAAVAHHAVQVLRLSAGASITLFDGTGGEYPAILEPDGRQTLARLGQHDPREAELGGQITLVQGLPSGDKMDWIVEKAIELGVHRIVTIAATRSVLRLSGDRLAKRLVHWQRIARAACEQCQRNRVPEIEAPVSLREWLAASSSSGECVMGQPDAALRLPEWLSARPALSAVSILVGPEGGWSEEEREAAKGHGVTPLKMGSRILRTETAGLALIATVSALAGWQT
jgi:16S rRNA (uracil1498-N3)-methyltransferase